MWEFPYRYGGVSLDIVNYRQVNQTACRCLNKPATLLVETNVWLVDTALTRQLPAASR